MTKRNVSDDQMVENPAHYNKGGVEAIDAIKASLSAEGFEAYLKGSVMKYLWRYESKERPAQDLAKAAWFLERLRRELDGSE